MAASPTAPRRDDDPPHPNFDGIVFYPTTDKGGVVVTPATGQTTPPVTFLTVSEALKAAQDIRSAIEHVRSGDSHSYLADYLTDLLEDFTAAIDACTSDA